MPLLKRPPARHHRPRQAYLPAQESAPSATVELLQCASVIATWVETAPSDTFTTITRTLSGAEADAITDYADLRVRVTATGVGGARVQVSWLQLAVPAAGVTGDMLALVPVAAAPRAAAPTLTSTLTVTMAVVPMRP